jgi:DNA-binding XRE family transcriptional regulator
LRFASFENQNFLNKDKVNIMTASANRVRQIREAKMMSKAELARKAEVTVQTIHRIENGSECRLDTKRKIILALGFELANRTRIFDEEELETETPTS